MKILLIGIGIVAGIFVALILAYMIGRMLVAGGIRSYREYKIREKQEEESCRGETTKEE